MLAEEYNYLFRDDLILLNKEVDVIKQIAEIQKTVNQLRKIEIDEVKYYDEIRLLTNLELVKDVIFETELYKKIGSQIYDVSDVRDSEIKNVIETTDISSKENINFEINIQLSLTLSNSEKEEDIDLEMKKLYFMLSIAFMRRGFISQKFMHWKTFMILIKDS